MKHFVRVLGIGLLLSFSTHVHAYEAISVTNGGSISGKVLLEGKEPPALAYSIVTNNDTEFCGRISTGTGWRIVDDFQVAPDGGLENVVVFLEDIQKGKPFAEEGPTKVSVEDCVFKPWLTVVKDQQPIHIINMDPIIHDVQIYETATFGPKIMLHRPLRLNPFHPKNVLKEHVHNPGEAMTDTLNFTQGRRLLFLECGFHPFMQSWGMAVNNPYYAITDQEGNFSISDVPEGVYKLVAWHAGMAGYLDTKVVVLGGEDLKTKLIFQDAKDKRASHNTMSPTYRFSTRALEREGAKVDVQVTHETQENAHQSHEGH